MVYSSSCITALTLSLLSLAFSKQRLAIANSPPLQSPQCTPLDPSLVPFCANLPYNATILPNTRGHHSLRDAFAEMNDFRSLILKRCSGAVVHFLCSVYTPPCYHPAAGRNSTAPVALAPCRSLCLEVRGKCEGFFADNFTSWPQHLACENFPDRAHSMCFGPSDPTTLTIPKIASLEMSPSPTPSSSSRPQLCNPLPETSMCRSIGYSNFSLPNFRGHRLISEATQELSLFKLFVQTKCSQAIAHFLCYYYAPPCSASHPSNSLPPCRELCEFTRRECLSVLESLGIRWPSHMNCDRFPHRNISSCNGVKDPRVLRIPANFLNQPQSTMLVLEPNSALGVIWQPISVTLTVLTSVAIMLYVP